MIYEFCRLFALALARIFYRLEVHNKERVPDEAGFLIVPNHVSFLDPPLVMCWLKRNVYTLAKSELFQVPFLGWLLHKNYSLPIRRGGVDRDAMKRCVKALRGGSPLLLFPEGTRSPDGQLGEPKPGAAMVGAQGKAPILPLYVEGTYRAWPKGRKIPRPGKVHIHVGEPFLLPEKEEGESSKEYYRRCAETMMEHIARTRDEAIDA